MSTFFILFFFFLREARAPLVSAARLADILSRYGAIP